MRTKPAGSAWKSVANSASPSEFSATARLARSNSCSSAICLRLGHQMQVERDQQRPRLRQARHRRRQRRRRRDGTARPPVRRQLPGIGGEFGMLLPAQRGAAERDAVLLGAGFQRIEPAPGAEIGERGAVGAWPASPAVSKAKCRMRRGVSIGVNGRACTSPSTAARKRMRREPRAVLDGDVRRHAPFGSHARGSFGKMRKILARNLLISRGVRLTNAAQGVSHDTGRSHGETSRHQAREGLDLEIHLRARSAACRRS